MTSKITHSVTRTRGQYDVYDMGSVVLIGATLPQVEDFIHDQQHGTTDLDPREFYPRFHSTEGLCWCGQPAVAKITSVDPSTGDFFQMPRCLHCLAGAEATVL